MNRTTPELFSSPPNILIEQVPPNQRKMYDLVTHLGWSRLRNRILQHAEKWLCDHPDAKAELRESDLSLKRLFEVDVFFTLITPGQLKLLLGSTQMVNQEKLLSNILMFIRQPCPEPFRSFLEDRRAIFAEWICQGIIEGVEARECYPWRYYSDSPIFRKRKSVEKEIAYLVEGMEETLPNSQELKVSENVLLGAPKKDGRPTTAQGRKNIVRRSFKKKKELRKSRWEIRPMLKELDDQDIPLPASKKFTGLDSYCVIFDMAKKGDVEGVLAFDDLIDTLARDIYD